MRKKRSKIINEEIYTPQTPEEILKVKDLLFKNCGSQMRDFWTLGAALGLRINELLQMKFDDLDLDCDQSSLKYTFQKSRNNKTISINVPSIAKEVISNIKKEHPKDTYVFQSRNSRNRLNKEHKPISRQAVYKAFKDVGEVLNERLTAHSMRRVFAKDLFVNLNQLPNSERSRIANNLIAQHFINNKDDQK
jgi:integrase